MMIDREYLYGSMIKDLYFLGKVLGKKYRLVRISYTIFMYGLIISVLAYILSFVYYSTALHGTSPTDVLQNTSGY